MSTFVHMPDQDAHEETSLEPGDYSYPFELKVPEGVPPSLHSGPADEDLHGDEAEPWLRTFFQDLKGTFRVRYRTQSLFCGPLHTSDLGSFDCCGDIEGSIGGTHGALQGYHCLTTTIH